MTKGLRKAMVRSTTVLCALCCVAVLPAAGVGIQGRVTDNSGKPIRGAIITISTAKMQVGGFTQDDGRYQITVPPGTYDVSVRAFDFQDKKQSTTVDQTKEINFQLSPGLVFGDLTGAEIQSALPDNPETRLINGTCIECHNLGTVALFRGFAAPGWKSFLAGMTYGTFYDVQRPVPNNPAQMDAVTQALEKYFGPGTQYLQVGAKVDPSQFHHQTLSNVALPAVFEEFTLPKAGSFPHSIQAATGMDGAWYGNLGIKANDIERFNLDTGEFQEYPLPQPGLGANTGAVDKDGVFWITIGKAFKLASVDPRTGVVTEYSYNGPEQWGSHTVQMDPLTGNLWFSSFSSPAADGSGMLWMFDVHTKQFKSYKYPIPASWPTNSSMAAYDPPWGGRGPVAGGSYYTAASPKGDIWFSQFTLGQLVRLDPEIGKTRQYAFPGIWSVKGFVWDRQGNLWFGDYNGQTKIGELNTETGAVKYYQPPTRYAAPYGVTIDPTTGYVWYGDETGNQLTRIDPKTGEFVEYPIPSPNAVPKFISVDSKGRVWFAEHLATNKIGVLYPDPAKEGGVIFPKSASGRPSLNTTAVVSETSVQQVDSGPAAKGKIPSAVTDTPVD